MARTDYGAILSTVIKDTSDSIREVNGTSALIAPNDWGPQIRTMKSASDYENALDQMVEETASGDIASFTDGGNDIPMKSVLCSIEAVQSGSGDPSPSNPRPISGWTEAKLSRVGKNLLTMDYLERGSISGSGSFINSSLRLRTSGSIYTMLPIKPSQVYTYSLQGAEGVTNLQFMEANEYSKNRVWLRNQALNKVTGQYTPSADCYYVIFLIRKSDNSTIDVSDVEYLQLEVGSSTATAYESYNGTTVTLQFGTTIYGGIIDWTSGVVTVTDTYSKISTVDSMGTSGGLNFFRRGITPVGVNTPTGRLICNVFKTSSSYDSGSCLITSNGASFHITPSDQTIDTVDKMRTWLSNNDCYICYELATPTTIQLTPQQINSLLGANNLWHDCNGQIDVTYRANGQLYVAQHS